jgi:hypothetical protein
MWVETNPAEMLGLELARRFAVFGTGTEIPNAALYCGTTLDRVDDGQVFVWHVYELPAKS